MTIVLKINSTHVGYLLEVTNNIAEKKIAKKSATKICKWSYFLFDLFAHSKTKEDSATVDSLFIQRIFNNMGMRILLSQDQPF